MRIFVVILLILVGIPVAAQDAPPLSFQLTFDPALKQSSFSGRVYVTATRREPRPISTGLNWFNPEPVFALDVKDWKAGTPVTLDAKALAFPKPLKDLPAGKYYVQAIMDRDRGGISVFASPGNLYSKPKRIDFDGKTAAVVELKLDQTYEPEPFEESTSVKYAEMTSKQLSDFHKRPMKMRAGVVLPKSYAKEPDRKYPVVYEITGFGGDHTHAAIASIMKSWDLAGTEVIWVVLDANCRLGHHVFADSANNGPVGTALVKEFIPYIEQTYRAIRKPAARLVTGHSSGGWASLWLQITYPEFFGGCWSTSPDPVDFRDFQRVNLYEPNANLFTDPSGEIRELSRGDRGKTLTFKSFSAMEDVLGRGGQLASFEATFSPRMPDGTPRKLWDRKTGAIDPVTAKSWEKYDIRKMLDDNWPTLQPKLKGKIHVWMGEVDTFYLDGAARLLKDSQAKLKSDAVIEIFPGRTHALVGPDQGKRKQEEMAAALKKVVSESK